MKVSNYLPKIYNKNTEMNNIIYSEEDELENNFKPELNNVFKDNFAKIASITGIEAWEKLLGIELDSNSDNLEYRRARILTKLSTTVPLTYRWLEQSLTDLVGANNFKIHIVYNTYILNINIANVFNDTAETLYNLYRPLIPSNMELYVNLFEEEEAELYLGAIMHEGERILIKSEVV